MIRTARVLAPLLLLPVLLTGCGSEKEDGAGTPADSAELDARAEAMGVAPETVYVTEVSGWPVIPQSVGVYGNDEYSAVYRNEKTKAAFGLFVDRRTFTAKSCPEQPLSPDSDRRVTCEHDGDAWYRKAGGHHEYAVLRDGIVIRFSAEMDEVDRAVLRRAAKAVHRPDEDELDVIMPASAGG